MNQQKLQELALQAQDELNQVVAGFKAKGWEYFKKALLVSGGLIFCGYVLLYKGTSKQFEGIQWQVLQLRETNKFAEEYRGYKLRLESFKSKFPGPEDRKDWLFNLILSTAKEEGVSIESISSQAETDRGDQPFIKLAIDLAVRGKYHQIGSWVARLEGAEHFCQIETFSLNRASSGGDAAPTGELAVNMSVATTLPKGTEGL